VWSPGFLILILIVILILILSVNHCQPGRPKRIKIKIKIKIKSTCLPRTAPPPETPTKNSFGEELNLWEHASFPLRHA
jgi:hypothetical protein